MAKIDQVRGEAAAEPKTAGKKSASKKKQDAPAGKIKLTLVRSPIGYPERQKLTVRALGLTRMHQSIEKADTPDNRSMAASIPHLVRVEDVA